MIAAAQVDWQLVARLLAEELARSDDWDRALSLLASLAERGSEAHRPAYAAAADLLSARIRQTTLLPPARLVEPPADRVIAADRMAAGV